MTVLFDIIDEGTTVDVVVDDPVIDVGVDEVVVSVVTIEAKGDDGDGGPSAYQVAVANGFVGSQAAWLASLVGAPGTTDYDDLENLPPLGTAAATDADDYATAAQGIRADSAVQPGDPLTNLDTTVTGAQLNALKTKVDGVEALADVTDGANVDAAGAVMNADTTTAAMGFVLDEDDMASNSPTKTVTQQSVKAYVLAKLAELIGAAPSELDTWLELVAAIQADESAISAINTALAGKQPIDSDLTAIAALTATTDNVIQSVGGAWASRTPAQLKSTLALGTAASTDATAYATAAQGATADTAVQPAGLTKSAVGLGSVDNTADTAKPVSTAQQTALNAKQPLDADLTVLAAIATDGIPRRTSGSWAQSSIGPTDAGTYWLPQIPYTSGQYYLCNSQATTSTSGSLTNNLLRVTPWVVTQTISVSRLFAAHTAAGEAGSTFRLGIYADDGTGKPGALVVDGGTIATSGSAAVQEVTISQTLQPGLYWVGGVVQGAPSSQPTLQIVDARAYPMPLIPLGSSIPATAVVAIGWQKASVTGALPNPFGTPALTSGAARIGFKVA